MMQSFIGSILTLVCLQAIPFADSHLLRTIIGDAIAVIEYLPKLPIDIMLYENDFRISEPFNKFQAKYEKEMLKVLQNVNVSDFLDDIDLNLQQAADDFASSLEPKYSQYGSFAKESVAVTLGLTGDIKTILSVGAKIALDAMHEVRKECSMSEIDSTLENLSNKNMPRSANYFKHGMPALAKRLKDEHATNFVQDAVNEYTAVNNRYPAKITNLIVSAEYALFIKIFLGYRTLMKEGMDDTLASISRLNLRNGLKDTMNKAEDLLEELEQMNVGNLLEIGRKSQQETSTYVGLPQNLMGYALNLVLSEIKFILSSISDKERSNVLSAISTVNIDEVYTSLEKKVNDLAKKCKRYKHEGASVGVAMTAHSLTRFLLEPFKSNLKSLIYMFLAVLQPVLKNVDKKTLAQLFGTAQANYLRLAILDQRARTYGAPVGA